MGVPGGSVRARTCREGQPSRHAADRGAGLAYARWTDRFIAYDYALTSGGNRIGHV